MDLHVERECWMEVVQEEVQRSILWEELKAMVSLEHFLLVSLQEVLAMVSNSLLDITMSEEQSNSLKTKEKGYLEDWKIH